MQNGPRQLSHRGPRRYHALAELHCICTGQVPSSLKLCTTISPAMICGLRGLHGGDHLVVISSALNSSSA
jgi:hypothetical protein